LVTSLTARPDDGERSARLLTADGVWIAARHDPAGPGRGADLGFVVAHGFTLHRRRPDVRAVVAGLSARGGVVTFDFRGHGGSGGGSTVGDLEVEDLRAAVAWARSLGYRRVVTVGWSMGAGVAIRHAGLHREVEAVVAVSGPSRWHYRGTAPMRLLHRGVETRIGRAVLALGYGTGSPPTAGATRPSRRTRWPAGSRRSRCWWCTGTPTATSRSSTPVGWPGPAVRPPGSGRSPGSGTPRPPRRRPCWPGSPSGPTP
jgi:pimeloyl-ACP methyl ester carboxylesterase